MHQEAASAKRESPSPQNASPQQDAHINNAPGQSSPKEAAAGNFLRNLLPKDLDTGDLLVIILLLLIAGDGNSDKSTALLTLAIYLFL